MKPQDILFFIVLAFLIYKRNPMWLVVCGLIFILLAMPLFQLQIFFTAQRLVMYSAALLFVGTIILLIKSGEK